MALLTADKWQPPLPPCVTLMKTQASLIIRETPSEQGKKWGVLPAGAIVRIDKADRCLLWGGQFRYVRLVSWGRLVYLEPLYIALEKIEFDPDANYLTPRRVLAVYLKPYRDECG